MEKILYHIDSVVVSLFKIHIEGWAVSKDGKEVSILSNKNIKVTKLMRLDVNKSHDFVREGTKCGFSIDLYSWKNVAIELSDGISLVKIDFDCFLYRKQYILSSIKKVLSKVKEVGVIKTLKIIWRKITKKTCNDKNDNYMDWKKKNDITVMDLSIQRTKNFKYTPLISIVVPTFNTPVNFLVEMIESVVAQTYQNWELCIADGASSDKRMINTLKEYEERYENIKVKYLLENKMISENTNEALTLVSGDFVGLFDHDDLLTPNALFEYVKLLNKNNDFDMIYSDEDKVDFKGANYFEPHFKPDFSKYTLRSYNYITHFTVIRTSILKLVGAFDSNCDGAQDYDMFLRICDITNKIGHIPKVLYHWRVHENSTAASASAKSYVTDAGKLALRKHLERNEINGEVSDGLFPTSYKINYEINDNPLVSIIIPSKDHIDDLRKCVDSLFAKTSYKNFEVIIVENNSEEEITFSYYEQLKSYENIKVVYWKHDFNFSAINNFGVKYVKGKHVLLLNNDVEIINENWLSEMLMISQMKDVGCVGAKLYYSDNSIQHAGIIIGIGGVAGHSHKYHPRESFGYVGRLKVIQNISAVTAACLMIKRELFEEANGLDEGYKVAFNDVDFCLRIIKLGYKNVFTPYAELFHYESKSRGLEDSEEKIKRFNGEIKRFENRWGLWMEDPYYNKNLTLLSEDFHLKESE